MEKEKQLPHLNAFQQRVLGSLMEKSKTTPEYYPMTINAITTACNQKTSRKPVVEYSENEVQIALNSLKALSLVNTAVGGGRVIKYKHNFGTVYPLSDGELAIICLLLLRGPQTPGELNTNSSRLHEFSSLESVLDALQKLTQAEPPFVKELGKRPGQKEARFAHLFGDIKEDSENEITLEHPSSIPNDLEERLTKVENELSEVKAKLDKLLSDLG